MFTLFFYFPLSKSLLQSDIFSFVDLDVYYSGLRRYNKTGNSTSQFEKAYLEGTYCLTSQTPYSSHIQKSSPGSEVIYLIFYF